MKNEEHILQVDCVNWFRKNYPELMKDGREKLYANPNGGNRPKKQAKNGKFYCQEGARIKREGGRKGVADLLLMVARGGDHGMYIEMKTPIGKQSKEQRYFEEDCVEEGYAYALCRSLDEFQKDCIEYLGKGRGVA